MKVLIKQRVHGNLSCELLLELRTPQTSMAYHLVTNQLSHNRVLSLVASLAKHVGMCVAAQIHPPYLSEAIGKLRGPRMQVYTVASYKFEHIVSSVRASAQSLLNF